MRPNLTVAERLIIAADFKPTIGGESWHDVGSRVLELAQALSDTGAVIKVNSILRAEGYGLIDDLVAHMSVFADLKLNDIGATMETDGQLLNEARVKFVTVMCSAGVDGMRQLKRALPNTLVLGVTVLTSLSEADSHLIYGDPPAIAAQRFARMAMEAGIDGLITSPAEVRALRQIVGDDLLLVTPGVRPTSLGAVTGDDQNPNRVDTPAGAIAAGADCVVIGRPILQAKDRRAAALMVIDELGSVAP